MKVRSIVQSLNASEEHTGLKNDSKYNSSFNKLLAYLHQLNVLGECQNSFKTCNHNFALTLSMF